jgi:hypothetical protein
MRYAVVSKSALDAAGSWSVDTFFRDPCGHCSHGQGQHKAIDADGRIVRGKNRAISPGYLVATARNGPCTMPGCGCPCYSSAEVYYGA